jgi:hypothetical protein
MIPSKFEKILNNSPYHKAVLDAIDSFESIEKNKMFFFPEYTDHGSNHIGRVLQTAEKLIPDEAFEKNYLQPQEVAILIYAVILHDMGMLTFWSTFQALLDGKYDDVKEKQKNEEKQLDTKTWKQLWDDYKSEIKHFSTNQFKESFGVETISPEELEECKIDELKGKNKKVIGEFIRRHHERLAHEFALKGIIGNDGKTISLGNNLTEQERQIVGIVARSHGMNIRDTFHYLNTEIGEKVWKTSAAPIHIVYLMVLLRIADGLQIDKTRTDEDLLKLAPLTSSCSRKEHAKHIAVEQLIFGSPDPESIYVNCKPAKVQNAQLYVEIQNLVNYIQHEFDLSWAILGEIYGLDEKTKIKYRRINSNLQEEESFLNKIDYVPQKIDFKINNELSKLLVAPLYGDNPTYGVRELVQNATDACKERIIIEKEKDKNSTDYESQAEVTVSIDKKNDKEYVFKIKDNGKGMTLDEIQNYFLSVGSSFRTSYEWRKEFTNDEGESLVNRNGQFGIGVLAAFLLGDKIKVKTRSYKNHSQSYSFETEKDSDFIDIKKIKELDIGTEIEIQITQGKFNQLTKQKIDISWTDWYIDEMPTVLYKLGGEIKQKRIAVNLFKRRAIQPKDFGKIFWKHSHSNINDRDLFTDYNVDHSVDKIIACNGIIITLSSNIVLKNGDILSSRCPHLSITDPSKKLPLSLNRNSLEIKRLPFEQELMEDIAKDFIAQLLTAPISLSNLQNKYTIIPHRTNFLYLAKGYTLSSSYFINKMRNNYYWLNVYTRDLHFVCSNVDEYAVFKIIDPSKKLNNLNNGYVMMSEKKQDQLVWKNKEIFKSSNHKIISGYYHYSFCNYKEKSNIFKIFKGTKKILLIQEIPFTHTTSQYEGNILNKLFEKYFNNNFIIPYEMEERKIKFRSAFEELADYIKDYETK